MGSQKIKRYFYIGLLCVWGVWVDTIYAQENLDSYPWLYLREDRPLDSTEQLVELIFVGDVMLGRDIASQAHPFARSQSWLETADLTVGNLEAVIARTGSPRATEDLQPYCLRAPIAAAAQLQTAGFDLMGMANNHALDFGSVGLVETITHLFPVAAYGIGPDVRSAQEPLFRQIDSVRLAFLAFNAIPDPRSWPEKGWQPTPWDARYSPAAIATARTQADVVIVSVHWGDEYQIHANPQQKAIARTMLEAGADLIIGHHPHVVQEIVLGAELTGNSTHTHRLVAYSLGNFLFDQSFGETYQGLALRIFVEREGLRAVQSLPVRAGKQPYLIPPKQAEDFLDRIQPAPRRLAFACDSQSCHLTDSLPSQTGSTLFWGDEIDLTGDGQPEKIRRAEQKAFIYQQSVEVWHSDPQWQIVDIALGDPNDDGRGEALMALWKPDETGVLRSHPFIIGYRKGIYRDIWGGSAVLNPIHEVELGDLDGDNVQELIVLESLGSQAQKAVSVWDWHGWGFNLRWRSPVGPYQELLFTDDPPLISVEVNP